MPDYLTKHTDTATPLRTQIQQGNGSPVSLVGLTVASIIVIIKKPDGVVVSHPITSIDDAVNGKVSYLAVATDTDVAGFAEVEWRVTFGNGTRQTFPGSGRQSWRIESTNLAAA